MKSPNEKVILRLVDKYRRIGTIPEASRKYCHFSSSNPSTFEVPHPKEILQYRVVITTVEMSLQLRAMNLQGSFSHIFIDEAAQVMECESIMPLTLASDRTCVVLTGDHMQISPKASVHVNQNFRLSSESYPPVFYKPNFGQKGVRVSFTPI